MASFAATEALREFGLALDELEASLSFLRASSKLRPRLNSLLNWQAIDGDAKRLVSDFLNQKSVELTSQYRGLVVVLSGAFEQLVRRLIHDAISAYNLNAKGFDSLPATIQVQNVLRTGRALAKSSQPLDHVSINYQVFVERLATCKAGAEKFTLNPEVFSYFISSITPGHLEEILGWIDTAVNWDDFGKVGEFEAIFGTHGAKATGKAVAAQLSAFTKLRNTIAHVGTGGVVVTDNDVEGFIRFFRILAVCLEDAIRTRFKSV